MRIDKLLAIAALAATATVLHGQIRSNNHELRNIQMESPREAGGSSASYRVKFWYFGQSLQGRGASANYILRLTPSPDRRETGPRRPYFTLQPIAQTVGDGQAATFSVAVGGTPPFEYQWLRNGFEIAGADAATYTTPLTSLSEDAAAYSCRVTNDVGSATSQEAILNVRSLAPSITVHPAPVSVEEGRTASFSVTAGGSAPLAYQWRRNGQAIAGANSFAYTTPPLTQGESGDAFDCAVTNAMGSATSNAAAATVQPAAPEFLVHPVATTAEIGQTATFFVEAFGSNLTYRWRRNGEYIPGAESPSYTTPVLALTDDGAVFSCVISNSLGAKPSLNAPLKVTVNRPIITQQPVPVTAQELTPVTLTVVATGSEPMTYQWWYVEYYANGNEYYRSKSYGSTSASLTIPSPSMGLNSYGYYCEVANQAGSILSYPVHLNILPRPMSFTSQPAAANVLVGQTALFQVQVLGTSPSTFQWTKNGQPIAGATSSFYFTPVTVIEDNGALFACQATNSLGSVTSNPAVLSVHYQGPQITSQPVATTVTVGQPATFTVAATSVPPISYQWLRNGVNIPGATSASYTIPATDMVDNGAGFRCSLSNSGGSVLSNQVTLTVLRVAPTIVTAPVSQTVNWGQPATFTVAAGGTDPLSYQWRKNGSALSGATSASYTLPAAATTDNNATFACVVTNSAGSVTSALATLTVTNIAPIFTAQPNQPNVFEGENAAFTVAATGTPTVTYQWRRNGVNISGATAATYTRTAVPYTDNGAVFTCAATNAQGTTVSADAILTVNPILSTITSQPGPQILMVGHSGAFSVVAAGTQPFSYQWFKNGVSIPGAQSSTYLTPPVAIEDNGANYSCQVINPAGTVTSTNAVAQVYASAPTRPQMVGGEFHSAILGADGRTWTWGTNTSGQLGNGTTTFQYLPDVLTGVSGITQLTAGTLHTAALKNDGTVWTWGASGSGELGRPVSPTPATLPGAIPGLSGILAIAAGHSHTFALRSDRTVAAWGYNQDFQLGDGTATLRSSPVTVTNLTNVSALDGGQFHSLALKQDGTVWAWGRNTSGQVGDGSFVNRATAVQATSLGTSVTAIAAGSTHSLAIKNDGTVWAWGLNSSGQLGDGTTTNRNVPVQVTALTGPVIAIAAGEFHSLALKADGTVWAWGFNGNGRLGDGTTTNRLSPVQVKGLTGIVSVGTGRGHSFAMRVDGTLFAWGPNASAQLGDKTAVDRTSPVQVVPIDGAVPVAQPSLSLEGGTYFLPQTVTVDCATPGAEIHYTLDGTDPTLSSPTIAAGGTVSAGLGATTLRVKAFLAGMPPSKGRNAFYNVAPAVGGGDFHGGTIAEDGRLWLWGSNSTGQQGTGNSENIMMPQTVAGMDNVVAFELGRVHSVALRADGTVWTWGQNTNGELGRSTAVTPANMPGQVAGFTDIKAISVGANHNFATRADGSVVAWGWNSNGILHNGNTANQLLPVPTVNLGEIAFVRAGWEQSYLVRKDGTVWAWGRNDNGQLGDGTTFARTSRVPVVNLSDIVDIAGGSGFTVALKADGTVWAWGLNAEGEVGDGTTTNRLLPVPLPGLSNIVAIAVAEKHTLALRRDGTVWAWGQNLNGRLGDGTVTNRPTPVQVPGLSNVRSIAVGEFSSFAIQADGTRWAWGLNTSAQLGDGTLLERRSPSQIQGVDPMQRVATPSLSVEGGLYSAPQTIIVDCATPGAEIHYTLDGSDPTPANPIIIGGTSVSVGPGTTTLRVKAFKSGLLTSRTHNGLYTFSLAIVGGMNHSGALAADGRVWEWGLNDQGQLGNGTNAQILLPQAVPGTLPAFTAVSAGENHMVALANDGTVWTWGQNGNGQLGRNSNAASIGVPGQVPGLTGIKQVAAGYFYSLALKNDGTLMGWGYNVDGQLHNGNTTQQNGPVAALNLGQVAAVAAGGVHVLGLKRDGTVWAWGWNQLGQLGDGTTTNRSSKVPVVGLSDVVALAGGERHSIALKADGTVWTWGLNSSGQLGDGSTVSHIVPAQVPSLSDVVGIAAGQYHSLALKRDGTVWAWGYNPDGELGDGTAVNRLSPVQVASLSGVVAISAGLTHSLAVKADGSRWVWGMNKFGQLGDRTTQVRLAPLQVIGIDPMVRVDLPTLSLEGGNYLVPQNVIIGCSTPGAEIHYTLDGSDPTDASTLIAAGSSIAIGPGLTTLRVKAFESGFLPSLGRNAIYTVAPVLAGGTGHSGSVTSEGLLWEWGYNDFGQLGDGTYAQATMPEPVQGLSGGLMGLSVGPKMMVALKSDSTVWTWGENTYGQLGRNTALVPANVPGQVLGLDGIKQVSTGDRYCLALRRDNTVVGWGYNVDGQLHISNTTQQNFPVAAVNLGPVAHLTAGGYHALGLKPDGTVWAWGYNSDGQIGDGTTTTRFTKVQVLGLSEVVNLAGGGFHSVAVKADGTVWTWGKNDYGQLGNGTTVSQLLPAQVPGLTNVVAVAASWTHTLALKRDGTVWAWGSNAAGRLGDGTITQRNTPTQVLGLTGIVSISTGLDHSLAVKSDGTLWVWGSNASAQLGDNSVIDRHSPMQVIVIQSGQSVAMPTLSVPGGTYLSAQTVTVDCPTQGADLHYTLDGTEPTPSSTSIAAGGNVIVGPAPTLLRVKAFKQGILPSKTVNGLYRVAVEPKSGRFHTLVYAADGRTWAWGSNLYGQLGTGGSADVRFPTLLNAAPATISVAAGDASCVALKSDGTVWTWGYSSDGVLGRSTATTPGNLPGQLAGLSNIRAIASGSYFGLALSNNGTLFSWGTNYAGQLGDGGYGDHHTPLASPILPNVTAMATGQAHAIVLRTDGTVWAWGDGSSGQLGHGSTSSRPLPGPVPSLNDVVAIAAGGDVSAAVKVDGTVWTWGVNYNGVLGDGTTTNRSIPVQVPGLTDIIEVATGGIHMLALKRDGTVWAWGYNGIGTLGNGTSTNSLVPIQVPGLSSVLSIGTGDERSFAYKADGTLWAWGDNGAGQLGDGHIGYSLTPVLVQRLDRLYGLAQPTLTPLGGSFSAPTQVTVACPASGVTIHYTLDGTEPTEASPTVASGGSVTIGGGLFQLQARSFIAGESPSAISKETYRIVTTEVSTGLAYSAVVKNGELWTWGANDMGQLGYGSNSFEQMPARVPGLTGVTHVATGASHTLALLSDGTVWSWGDNAFGQLGRSSLPTGTPGQVPGLTGVTVIAAGATASYAVKADGTLWSWGNNARGQLGLGSGLPTMVGTPTQVTSLSSVVGVAGGAAHAVAFTRDGTVYNWGDAASQQVLGAGSGFYPTPSGYSGFPSTVVAVAAGTAHSLALLLDGTVLAWGDASLGQLGCGTFTHPWPDNGAYQVMNLKNVMAIAASYNHSLALTSDGILWAWGQNTSGQLGIGTFDNMASPVPVLGLSGVVSFDAGNHSLALTQEGLLSAWGSNGSYQLGDQTNVNRTNAVSVQGELNTGAFNPTIYAVSLVKDGYPDPENMELSFKVSHAGGTVSVDIHKWPGPNLVKTINLGSVQPDQPISLTWNSRDENGNPVPQGIYVPVIHFQHSQFPSTWGRPDLPSCGFVPGITSKVVVQGPSPAINEPMLYSFFSNGWGKVIFDMGPNWKITYSSSPYIVHPGTNVLTWYNKDPQTGAMIMPPTSFFGDTYIQPTPHGIDFPIFSFKVFRPDFLKGVNWGSYAVDLEEGNLSNVEVDLNKPASVSVQYLKDGAIVHQFPQAQYQAGKNNFIWHGTRDNIPEEDWLEPGDYMIKLQIQGEDGDQRSDLGSVTIQPPFDEDAPATSFSTTPLAKVSAVRKTAKVAAVAPPPSAPSVPAPTLTLKAPIDWLRAYIELDKKNDMELTLRILRANGFASLNEFLTSLKNALDLLHREDLDSDQAKAYDEAYRDYERIVLLK